MGCASGKDKRKMPKGITLDEILVSENYMQMFREFLVETLCDENLDFYVAVLDFKLEPSKEKSDAILDKFIAEEGPRPINFEYESERENLISKYNEKFLFCVD
eukprot:TRINITY_DN3843_c0_g1_i2.p2 TRINITY_DN3843_c0_g1~~TRINITY_DN3843_c0_g1_i2.p2  ORF type:complete len:103 (+),score=34.53 TRINITY_DN3843_c0_g1_i2:77-385(+)